MSRNGRSRGNSGIGGMRRGAWSRRSWGIRWTFCRLGRSRGYGGIGRVRGCAWYRCGG